MIPKNPPMVRAEHEVSFDENNERSLLNIVPDSLAQKIRHVIENFPKLVHLPEADLRRKLCPTDTEDELRLAFWVEFNHAQDTKKRMRLVAIFSRLMSDLTFYKYMENPNTILWMITPPGEYMHSLKTMLGYSRDKLREILKAPIYDKKGRLMVKEAQIFLRAHQLIENRVLGAAIQRVEQKSQQQIHLRAEVEQGSNSEELVKEYETLKAKYDELNVLDVPPLKGDEDGEAC